jgi:hypothetical protein
MTYPSLELFHFFCRDLTLCFRPLFLLEI